MIERIEQGVEEGIHREIKEEIEGDVEVLRLALKRLKKNAHTSAGFATYAGTQTVWRITPPANESRRENVSTNQRP